MNPAWNVAYRNYLELWVCLIGVASLAIWLVLALGVLEALNPVLLGVNLFLSGIAIGLLWAKVRAYDFRVE